MSFQHNRNREGFTLIEVLVASVIFIIAFLGILFSYIRCMELSELSKNSSLAIAAAKTRIEQIKNTSFDQIFSNHNNVSFAVSGLTARGVSYVDNSNPNLFQITVDVSWKQKNGRILGEDEDLDGQIDTGEDKNNNGKLDSPVQLVTYIYNKNN